MERLTKIFYFTLIGVAVALGALLLAVQTSIIPGYEAKIVQSGSMEPAIKTGALIIVKAEERYMVDDVVTFTTRGTSDIPTTHRIIEDGLRAGDLVYFTKGDANATADQELVLPANIIGKVILAIPFLGYLLDFARQPLGFFLLIGIPVILIMIEEVGTIVAEVRKSKKGPEKSDSEDE
jgi:signal peptidase